MTLLQSTESMCGEVEMARAALVGNCLLDTSALHTLALLGDVAPTLLALIARPVITDVSLQDLVDADDTLSMPTHGTLAYDTAAQRVVGHGNDPNVVVRYRQLIQTMLATGRGLRRISHPDMTVLRPPGDGHPPLWALTLDAAKHNNFALWADDTGLRTVAHSLGIKTSSTHALLAVAAERQ